MRTPEEALAAAREHLGSTRFHGRALGFVREVYGGTEGGCPARFLSALEMWLALPEYRHPASRDDQPPNGALLFFRTGAYGYVAIYDAERKDIVGTGLDAKGTKVSATYSDFPVREWNATYLGWMAPEALQRIPAKAG